MRPLARRSALAVLPAFDVVAAALAFPAAGLLRLLRRVGLHRLPASRAALARVGLLPVRDHYYEPYVRGSRLRHDPSTPRPLAGLDLDVAGQLAFLASLRHVEELDTLGATAFAGRRFRFDNRSFGAGDAEILYLFIRNTRPRRIYEIGSGVSTLVALEAIARNRSDDASYECEHVCIEPFEAPWLDAAPVRVLRTRVELLPASFWSPLGPGDLLFIDSSHVVRPQGDVLYEYLEVLPALAAGVFVHVHDIFTPRDYPRAWLLDEMRLWQEQYLVEAILTSSRSWQVVAALNHLHHEHPAELRASCPHLTPACEPGSLYLRKRD